MYEIVCLEPANADVSAAIRITKINLDGIVIWSQRIFSAKSLGYPSVCASPDSGSLICCTTLNDTATHLFSVDLIKLNEAGTIQWTVSMSDSSEIYNPQNYSIGNSFYVSHSYISDNHKIRLLKFSYNGIMLWNKQFSFLNSAIWTCMGTISQDQKIILTGTFDTYNYLTSGLYVFIIDTNGTVLSCNKYTGEYEYPRSCMVDFSGNIVIAGTVGTSYGTLVKISKEGDLVFYKHIEFGVNYDEIWDVLQARDSSYYLVAEPESYIAKSQVGILKFDKDGNFLWMKIYGGKEGSFPFNGVLNADLTITIAGTRGTFGESADIYLLKVDSDGNASCSSHSEVPDIIDAILTPESGYSVDSNTLAGSLVFTQQSSIVKSYDVCDSIDLGVNFIGGDDDHFELPALLTPNGTNPYWQITNAQSIHSIQFLLCDIYGRIVFHSTDPLFKWNGTVNGIALPSGLYCWSARAIFDGSSVQKLFSGKVILIR